MKQEGEFERSVAKWYNGVPHFPASVRAWLARSAWWITLLFVLFAGIGAFSLLLIVLVFGAVLTSVVSGLGAAIGGIAFIIAVGSMFFLLVSIILGAMAIGPLRAMQKRGWRLLFYVLVVNAVADILSLVVHQNILLFLGQIAILLLVGYVLFEIRRDFSAKNMSKPQKSLPDRQA